MLDKSAAAPNPNVASPRRDASHVRDGGAAVVILHPSEAELGGIVAAVLFYALALKAAGHAAEIWTPSQVLKERAESLGIPVFFHKGLRNAASPIVHPAIVAKALKGRRHAKAILHQGEKHWLFSRIWFSGIDNFVVFHNEKINQRRFFKHWLALSERQRLELMDFARQRKLQRSISIIRNGPLPSASIESQPRPARPIERIGAISNFGDRKGMDILIRAFQRVAAEHVNARLVLAGDGFEREACRHLAEELGIADRIEWPGWQWDPGPFFSGIDLFCLPSRKEPFGIVVTEAMQAGLAVIATDTHGPADIVVPGKTGWLVPVGDADALAEAILDAICNPAKTAAFAAAGLARFQSAYSPHAAGPAIANALGL
ncbi:MAG TPA: glycosyltransferase [Hyphomicrobiales bacterium]|nr:glycosyltransferase [Hyphomicrobiales bacterium]